MIIRDAGPNDNAQLIDLERSAPQGTRIKLVSERTDYFVRARRFVDPVLKIAVDEKTQDILGIMGVGPVKVSLGGATATGGLIFDWRSNIRGKNGLPRHIYRLWQAVEQEVAARKLDFLFGYVKEDNLRSLGILMRSGAQIVEEREFLTLPVHRAFCRNIDSYPVLVEPCIDVGQDGQTVRSACEGRDLLPLADDSGLLQALTDTYLQAKVVLGDSSLKIWDSSADYTQKIMHMPLLYHLARPVFAAVSPIFPKLLPRIPQLGEAVHSWYLYDLLIQNPDDLPRLLEKTRLLACSRQVDYLVICMNAKEAFYPAVASLAWLKLKYYLLYNRLNNDVAIPAEPTYFDIKYI